MAITTVRDLINQAFVVSGQIGMIETPSNEESTFALDQLNMMVESWDLKSLWPYTKKIQTGQFVTNQNIYTIGLEGGEDIPIGRPDQIINFGFFQSESSFIPLESIGNSDFQNSYRSDSISSLPVYYTYYPDYPSSRIQIYPKPSSNYNYELQYDISISNYGLNDNINLPAGYVAPVMWGLAAVLCDSQGINNPNVQNRAKEYFATVQKLNFEPATMSFGNLPRGRSKSWDVRADAYR